MTMKDPGIEPLVERRGTPTRYTRKGVRMRLATGNGDALNWLLLPGGPGIGSESLAELAGELDVPGSVWLVDLPGDGSNVTPMDTNPYADWPQVLLEAARAVPNPVLSDIR